MARGSKDGRLSGFWAQADSAPLTSAQRFRETRMQDIMKSPPRSELAGLLQQEAASTIGFEPAGLSLTSALTESRRPAE